jgi:hypothetical protein
VVEAVDCVVEINESVLTLKEELNTVAPLTVNPPVTPKPPAVILTLEENVATPVTPRVEDPVSAPTDVREVWNVDAPVTPIPPFWTRVVEANVATPDTDNVELAVTAPTDVSDVWNTDAPVIPIPPEVTNKADELV